MLDLAGESIYLFFYVPLKYLCRQQLQNKCPEALLAAEFEDFFIEGLWLYVLLVVSDIYKKTLEANREEMESLL